MSAAGAAVLGIVIGLTNIKQLGIYAASISQIVAADISTAEGWVTTLNHLAKCQPLPGTKPENTNRNWTEAPAAA
jgi:ribosomal protein L18E